MLAMLVKMLGSESAADGSGPGSGGLCFDERHRACK